jgi:RNA polymerase sigma factor (sigma-70 family)
MTRLQTAPFARDFETLCRLGIVGGVGDCELLARFVAGDGDDRDLAFSALIDRHGPMVLRVCLGVLKDRHDAEDAAQATFLVLARRARAIRQPGSLGPWLHGVALRTALRARAGASRRRDVERKAGEEVAMREHAAERFTHDEALHEEIDRLPERYKAAVVACDLEGLTHAQAAERLNVPVRTLQTRLYRGHERLRTRLVRRGVGLAAVEAVLNAGKPAEAALSAAWKEATARAAVSILEGASPVASGLVAERVVAWSQSLASGRIGSLAVSAVVLAASSSLLVGGAALANRKPDADEPPPAVKAPAQPERKDAAPNPIVRPLPDPEEIKQVLREAADAAIRIAEVRPNPGSSTLLTLASTQMSVGDRDGALKTLRAAEDEMSNGRKANPVPAWFSKLAQTQLRMGLKEESLRALQEAARGIPQASADFGKNYGAVLTLAEIVRTERRAGFDEQARENVKRMETLIAGALRVAPVKDTRGYGNIFLRELAAVQTMVGDVDGAFATVDRAGKSDANVDENRRLILTKIAGEATLLEPGEARRFVDRLKEEVEKAKSPEVKRAIRYSLVRPLARLGDVAEARRLAREVAAAKNAGPIASASEESVLLEMVAFAQQASGDLVGSRESLRLAFEAIQGQAKSQDGANRCRGLAAQQAGAGDLDGALRTVESLEPGQEGGSVYPLVALRFAIKGETDRAMEVLRKAKEDLAAMWKELPEDRSEALKFNPTRAMFALEVAALVHSLAGEVNAAVAAARQIPDGVTRGRALSWAVTMVAQAGDLREALKLAQSYDSPDDRRQALESLATGLSSRIMAEKQLKESDEVKKTTR